MLDLSAFDVQQIAMALADQTDYERAWLIDPATGEFVFWTSDTGIDGENPVDLDELDHLIFIEPLPPEVWYRDMEDFVDGISEGQAGRRLARALGGRGAFRRFKDAIHREGPELLSAWNAFRTARAERRAVEWLLDHQLVTEDSARTFLAERPDPALP